MRSVPSRRQILLGAGAGLAALGCQGALRKAAASREVERVVAAVATRDGAGVALRRALGGRPLPMLDPFLMLDEIKSDRPEDFEAGFPTHPHRGFETVSYLIDGRFEHADSVGNRGVIGPGDVQWMTAGRGIVHSEMPRQEPGRLMWGLQLWLNLPAADKMTPPRYQELGAAAIPTATLGDARVRLVAGALDGVRGPIDGIVVAPILLDAALPPGGRFVHRLPDHHAAFLYCLDGELAVGQRGVAVPAASLAVLGPGRDLAIAAPVGGRFLLLAARPIGEPVARRGPFVMNSEAELDQAVADFRSGRLVDG
jgi:quercetin 2,3-dioxygenase